MTQAIHASGTLFQRGNGATPTEVFTTLAEITEIGGPQLESEDIDVTSMDSNGWREYVAGLKDGGEISIDGNFVPKETTHAQMITDFNAGTVSNYQILLPDAELDANKSKWTFAAKVKSLEFSHPADGVLGFSAALKISGQPTLTPGT
ncbi:MAG: hypothetical protein JL50_02935 [Peptococcaceae bacterium BICA1-7]|nr:MAG: hypothetical protein JL50_02935 [Peptococcaceae bacterium BICA1-7]HBV97780.1 outer capsid protein Hoc [Desulfotomaculum sp.]